VARLIGRLRTGDAMQIDGTRYRVSGFAWLAAPDGSRWCEWLLVPSMLSTTDAMATDRHCWLSDGAGERPYLWRPLDGAKAPPLGDLRPGSTHVLEGKRFRVSERDSALAERIDGDLGDDLRTGDRFDYVELQTTGHMISVEWDALGVDVYAGRGVSRGQVEQWAAAAGTRLPMAAAVVNARSKATSESDSSSILTAVIMVPILLLALMMESCDRDDDCYRRYNAQTAQYETVCEDGIRRSGGRSFGGWGGK
jgi:hypothetical protein